MTKEFSKTIKESVDDLLAYLALSDIVKDKVPQIHQFSLASLPPTEPFVSSISEKTHGNERSFFVDAKPSDIDPRQEIRCSIMSFQIEKVDEGYYPKEWADKGMDKFVINSFRQVKSPAEFRGMLGAFRWPLYVSERAIITDRGFYHPVRTFSFFDKANNRWMRIVPGGKHEVKHQEVLYDEDEAMRNNIALGILFGRRYEWAIEIDSMVGPKLRLIVPPRAIHPLFKLRDVPEGKERRSSLKHWVESYFRQPADDGEAIEVRKHLRGNLNFKYEGLNFNIVPAQFDIDQNERYKLEADLKRKNDQ